MSKTSAGSHPPSILYHLKEGYLIWLRIVPHMPKGSRYTIGTRIETIFLDLLEKTYVSYFTEKETKAARVAECVLTLDSLKFLLSIAWDAQLLSHTQYKDISLKLAEIGKMFGGWRKSLEKPIKKNRTLSL